MHGGAVKWSGYIGKSRKSRKSQNHPKSRNISKYSINKQITLFSKYSINKQITQFSFQTGNLCKFADKIPFILTIYTADMASSNTRLKSYILSKILDNNAENAGRGCVMLIDVVCTVHVITRCVIKTFRYSQLIPRCFSLCWTMRFPPRFNACLKVVREKIDRDLHERGGYIIASHAPSDFVDHNMRVFSLTLLRSIRVRGRAEDEDSIAKASRVKRRDQTACQAARPFKMSNITVT